MYSYNLVLLCRVTFRKQTTLTETHNNFSAVLLKEWGKRWEFFCLIMNVEKKKIWINVKA